MTAVHGGRKQSVKTGQAGGEGYEFHSMCHYSQPLQLSAITSFHCHDLIYRIFNILHLYFIFRFHILKDSLSGFVENGL